MLRSDNLILRAMELEDADILYGWENDMSIWHLSNTLTPFSRFTLEQYVMNAHQDFYTIKHLRMMIDLTDSPQGQKTIGSIDLFEFEPNHMRAGVGILLHKDYRKKGYASEGARQSFGDGCRRNHPHPYYRGDQSRRRYGSD